MLVSHEQIEKLSLDEYLQFLIEVYFKFYDGQPVLLTVYNVRKQNVFSSQYTQKLFNYTSEEKLGSTVLNGPLSGEYPDVAVELDKATDYVINNKKSCNCIIFDQYKGNFGALNVRIDPIFKGEHVAGIVSRSFNFTKTYFGLERQIETSTEPKISIDISKVNNLTPRQKQVLFLVLLNFNQEKIASSLGITRGTVSRLITSICERLQLKFTSAYYLIEVLDKLSIFSALYRGDIPFKPLFIFVDHEFEMF